MKINAEQYDKILAHLRLISASDIDAKKRDTTLTELLNGLGVAVGRVEQRVQYAEDSNIQASLENRIIELNNTICTLSARSTGRLEKMEGQIKEFVDVSAQENTLLVGQNNTLQGRLDAMETVLVDVLKTLTESRDCGRELSKWIAERAQPQRASRRGKKNK